jgi:hypothetical protein
MDAKDLAARVKRLDALTRGLAKETAEVQADTLTVLLYRERRGYLEGVRRAPGGVETAPIVLARAIRRREQYGEERSRAGQAQTCQAEAGSRDGPTRISLATRGAAR